MLIAVWPLVIAVVGLLLWALSSNGKAAEVGKWMFVVGMFWLVYSLTGKTVRLG
jgi:hypothetical protein